MPELSKEVQAAVKWIGETLTDGPRTLNELRDKWNAEHEQRQQPFTDAASYLVKATLIEAFNLGKTKMLALPGQRHKPSKGSAHVMSTPAAAPPPEPAPPAPPPASTSPGSAPADGEPTRNVGSASPQGIGATEWIPVPELAELLGIAVVSVAEAVSRRRRQGKVIEHITLPGKGKPRAFRRAHVELWLMERKGGEQLAAAIAGDVQRSNGKRAAIEDALYGAPAADGGKVIELPPIQVGDVAHVPGRNQRGVVVERKPNGALPASGGRSMHVAISDEHWALLERLAATGLYGVTDPDALAHRFMLDELRRHIHVPQTYQRAVRG